MPAPPRFSVTLSGLHRIFGATDLRWLVELAGIADERGIDQVTLSDHVAMGERTDRYPYGKFPFAPDEPWMEPLTTLAAIAATTRHVRLSTGILIAPLRPAVLLAKTAATLDVLSAGRLDLGVGIGWQEEEYAALGVPFTARWQRLDDTMRACRRLWSEVPASFQSDTVQFERTYSTPRPLQARLPIWLGAKMSAALARRIAEYGDGWLPLATMPLDEVYAGAAELRAAFAAVGRPAESAGVRAGLPVYRHDDGRPDVARMLDAAKPAMERGITLFALPMAGVGSLDDARTAFDTVARLRATVH